MKLKYGINYSHSEGKYNKLKLRYSLSKHNIEQAKMQAKGMGKIFAVHISTKGILYRIYNMFRQFTKQKLGDFHKNELKCKQAQHKRGWANH